MKEVKNAVFRASPSRSTPMPTPFWSRYLDSLKATYAETADGDEIVADIRAHRRTGSSRSRRTRAWWRPRSCDRSSRKWERPRTSRPKAKPTQPKSSRASRAVSTATPRTPAWAGVRRLGRYFDVDATWVRLTLFRTAAVVDPRRGTALLRHPLDLLLQPVRRLRTGLLPSSWNGSPYRRTLRAAEARNGGRADHRALDPRKNRSGQRRRRTAT